MGSLTLVGGQTVTFSGPGVYVFKSIKNTGIPINNFKFDFANKAGTIKIYVYGDVDVNILNESFVNGGDASRIFLETHGTGTSCSFGSFAFTITNYFLLGRTSQWFGTVWAPYAGINIGSNTSSSAITGAMWSGTQVNVQCGVKFSFQPFVMCSTPNVNAGPDQTLVCPAVSLTLSGSSTTPGAVYSWSAYNGGTLVPPVNASSVTATSKGNYVLTYLIPTEDVRRVIP